MVVWVILLNDLFYINIELKRNAQQCIMRRWKVLHMLLEVRRFYLNWNLFMSCKVVHKPSNDFNAGRSDEPQETFLAFFRRHLIHFKSNIWSIVQPHWRNIITNNNVCSSQSSKLKKNSLLLIKRFRIINYGQVVFLFHFSWYFYFNITMSWNQLDNYFAIILLKILWN